MEECRYSTPFTNKEIMAHTTGAFKAYVRDQKLPIFALPPNNRLLFNFKNSYVHLRTNSFQTSYVIHYVTVKEM